MAPSARRCYRGFGARHAAGRVGRVGLVLVVAGAVLWALNGMAIAGHCGASDKDHLADGSCGYFVEPVSSPAPATPSPLATTPVSVENEPTVKIKQPAGDGPLRVTVENPASPAPGDGWRQEDRETLRAIAATTDGLAKSVIFASGLALFALAGILVSTLPRVR